MSIACVHRPRIDHKDGRIHLTIEELLPELRSLADGETCSTISPACKDRTSGLSSFSVMRTTLLLKTAHFWGFRTTSPSAVSCLRGSSPQLG